MAFSDKNEVYKQVYMLVDCNNFFASCETIFRPDLEGRPILVLSNNDGCVVARSAESKALGIPMGIPVFKIRDIIRKHKIVCFSSNFTLYQDISRRVMTILSNLSYHCEVYSVDEAFLRFEDITEDEAIQTAVKIRNAVSSMVGIQVGIGIAKTKTLAKLANHHAKSNQQDTFGIYSVLQPTLRYDLLRRNPVEEVWGVGRRLAERLREEGVKTAMSLADQNFSSIKERYNVVLMRTVEELNDIAVLPTENLMPVTEFTDSTFEQHWDKANWLQKHRATLTTLDYNFDLEEELAAKKAKAHQEQTNQNQSLRSKSYHQANSQHKRFQQECSHNKAAHQASSLQERAASPTPTKENKRSTLSSAKTKAPDVTLQDTHGDTPVASHAHQQTSASHSAMLPLEAVAYDKANTEAGDKKADVLTGEDKGTGAKSAGADGGSEVQVKGEAQDSSAAHNSDAGADAGQTAEVCLSTVAKDDADADNTVKAEGYAKANVEDDAKADAVMAEAESAKTEGNAEDAVANQNEVGAMADASAKSDTKDKVESDSSEAHSSANGAEEKNKDSAQTDDDSEEFVFSLSPQKVYYSIPLTASSFVTGNTSYKGIGPNEGKAEAQGLSQDGSTGKAKASLEAGGSTNSIGSSLAQAAKPSLGTKALFAKGQSLSLLDLAEQEEELESNEDTNSVAHNLSTQDKEDGTHTQSAKGNTPDKSAVLDDCALREGMATCDSKTEGSPTVKANDLSQESSVQGTEDTAKGDSILSAESLLGAKVSHQAKSEAITEAEAGINEVADAGAGVDDADTGSGFGAVDDVCTGASVGVVDNVDAGAGTNHGADATKSSGEHKALTDKSDAVESEAKLSGAVKASSEEGAGKSHAKTKAFANGDGAALVSTEAVASAAFANGDGAAPTMSIESLLEENDKASREESKKRAQEKKAFLDKEKAALAHKEQDAKEVPAIIDASTEEFADLSKARTSLKKEIDYNSVLFKAKKKAAVNTPIECSFFSGQDSQSITWSRSFNNRLYEFEELHEAIANFVALAAQKLRAQCKFCRKIGIHIRTSYFGDGPKYVGDLALRFDIPTSDTRDLVKAAVFLLSQVFRPGFPYAKAGIILTELSYNRTVQSDLLTYCADPNSKKYDTSNRERSDRLMAALDNINSRGNHKKIYLASQGHEEQRFSAKKSLSPCYTTKWKDLPTIE